jgi:2-succinyl-5-enolpyruvyl-6-hydroxy-3-cyclohexene-1-carboxylate synthase
MDFPSNLKIVVVNDGGGGIFRLLDGPGGASFSEVFQVTHHPVSLELLTQAFGRTVIRVTGTSELEEGLRQLFDTGHNLSVLEADTTGCENSRIFKDFLKTNPSSSHG